MIETKPIKYDNNIIGEAQITRKGLYHNFNCRIQADKNKKYRLYVCSGDDRIDLGICIPDGDGYRVKKTVASKMLKEDTLEFYILNSGQDKIVEISESEPFGYLDRLHSAVFVLENEKPAIRIKELP